MRTLFGTLFLLAFICYLWMWYLGLNFLDNNGVAFGIMDLELPGGKENLQALISSMPLPTKATVLNNLGVDYIFMACTYFGIAILCMMAQKRIKEMNTYQDLPEGEQKAAGWRKLMGLLVLLQMLAWCFDVCENARLIKWIELGQVGNMLLFEPMVYLKFNFAFAGFFTAAGLLLLTANRHKKLKEVWKKK